MGETLVRGAARMAPALASWRGRTREEWVDGGYYCKTRENRPLIGPLPVEGAYVVAGLSGFGLMASQAAGELGALHILEQPLPGYAAAHARGQEAKALVHSLMAADRTFLNDLEATLETRRQEVHALDTGGATLAAYKRVVVPKVATAAVFDTRG